MELKQFVNKSKDGDIAAFTELVRAYQNMALASAFSMLHDFAQAEDAVQDAFVAAHRDLAKLKDPRAFPGWLRGIVRHQCHRILRKRHVREVSLEEALELSDEASEPDRKVEQIKTRDRLLAHVGSLPQADQEILVLFYVQEYSQREIAAFLKIPVTTVNNRLHGARKLLKGRMLTMVKNTLKENALPGPFAE